MTKRDFTEYRNKIIAVASQAVIDDRIMVSRPVKIPARNFAIVPTKCLNMLSGEWKHALALNSKIDFQIYIWNPCSMITPMLSGKMLFHT